MISIIIPVYNVEKFLPQCIDSILAQTYKDFELILVDDGSPDGSPAICDSYAQRDERVRVIHQKNAGVSAARNNGIEHAKGEWISFVDSDDWVEPSYIEDFHLDQDDADMIVQGLEYYDNRNGQFFKQIKVNNCTCTKSCHSTIDGADFKQKVAENNLLGFGYPVAKAYRKSLLGDNVRFDTSISFHEDHIFVLDALMQAKKIRLVDSLAYKYRYYHTPSSLSTKRHPWENMNRAGDEMLTRFAAMKDRFYVGGSDYEKRILTFAYDCKMTAASSIILSDDKYSVKKSRFHQVINNKQLAACYFPLSTRSKLTKFIYQHLPFACAYLYHKSIEFLKKIR